jgi:hypothetical protein
MEFNSQLHQELTEQHYQNLIALGYIFMESQGYLEMEEVIGTTAFLFKPLRIRPQGTVEIFETTDVFIEKLVKGLDSMLIFIERNY